MLFGHVAIELGRKGRGNERKMLTGQRRSESEMLISGVINSALESRGSSLPWQSWTAPTGQECRAERRIFCETATLGTCM